MWRKLENEFQQPPVGRIHFEPTILQDRAAYFYGYMERALLLH